MSYFDKVATRLGEVDESDQAQQKKDFYDHLVLAMRAVGMDVNDDDELAEFVDLLKHTSVSKLKMAREKLTGTRATAAVKATKTAAKQK